MALGKIYLWRRRFNSEKLPSYSQARLWKVFRSENEAWSQAIYESWRVWGPRDSGWVCKRHVCLAWGVHLFQSVNDDLGGWVELQQTLRNVVRWVFGSDFPSWRLGELQDSSCPDGWANTDILWSCVSSCWISSSRKRWFTSTTQEDRKHDALTPLALQLGAAGHIQLPSNISTIWTQVAYGQTQVDLRHSDQNRFSYEHGEG
jgi:hypothetical protein